MELHDGPMRQSVQRTKSKVTNESRRDTTKMAPHVFSVRLINRIIRLYFIISQSTKAAHCQCAGLPVPDALFAADFSVSRVRPDNQICTRVYSHFIASLSNCKRTVWAAPTRCTRPSATRSMNHFAALGPASTLFRARFCQTRV